MNISGKNRMAIVTIIFLLSNTFLIYGGGCLGKISHSAKVAPAFKPEDVVLMSWIIRSRERLQKAHEEEKNATQQLQHELKQHNEVIDFVEEIKKQREYDEHVRQATRNSFVERRLSRSNQIFFQKR